MKRLRVYKNEVFVYKLKGIGGLKKNIIADMRDDTLFFINGEFAALKEIRVVLAGRSNRVTRAMYKVGIRGGIFLICIDAFNHLITSDPGIVDERVAKVAAGMFMTGCVIKLFSVRRIHPGKNKVLKIIDFGF